MHITEAKIEVCKKCYAFTGHLIEQYNGFVPVNCFCQLSIGKQNNEFASIIGGVYRGKIQLKWAPCSSHRGPGGHVSYTNHFTGFGWHRGNKHALQEMEEWLKKRNYKK